MCGEMNFNDGDCKCLEEILKKIVKLQRQDFSCDVESGCDKPFLGPTPSTICYNTRPISLYNCTTGALWTIPYTLNGIEGESTVFRVENVDDCCATFRVLVLTEGGTYTATTDFFTINLKCVSALRCFADTYVDLC